MVYSRMTTCRETRAILDIHAGGRARWEGQDALREHLAGCVPCRHAVSDYTFVVGQARAVFPAGGGLNDFVRTRLARQAADETARAPWWRRLVPAGHTPTWAAVAPALVVALVVTLPLALRHQPSPVASGEVPVRLDMQAHDGAVSVAWSDGKGKAYRVYKSSDPRRLGQGQPEVVNGNQWVDENPESSQIVFYRVE
jgi:hypothetical protein